MEIYQRNLVNGELACLSEACVESHRVYFKCNKLMKSSTLYHLSTGNTKLPRYEYDFIFIDAEISLKNIDNHIFED